MGLLALLLPLAVACGQGKDEEPTPSPTPQVAVPDIHELDFEQVEQVQRLIDSLGGGEVVPSDVVFADVTGDGRDEAVVPISSGGTAGNVAYAVFGYQDGALTSLLTVRPETGRVAVEVEDGVLKETQPLYGPEDPLCCPSQLQNTFYGWDGQELAVDRQEIVEAEGAKP